MKLHFEPNLDYQLQAVEAVCGYLNSVGPRRSWDTILNCGNLQVKNF